MPLLTDVESVLDYVNRCANTMDRVALRDHLLELDVAPDIVERILDA